MYFDYYAWLSKNTDICQKVGPSTTYKLSDLICGFVDECTYSYFRSENNRNKARTSYIKHSKRMFAKTFSDDRDASAKASEEKEALMKTIEPDFLKLPSSSWIGLTVEFKLLSPWYSRDDSLLHVLDNPVRKDRGTSLPFMSASSWKGLLRWAFRMVTSEDEAKKEKWSNIEIHLFGNDHKEEETFQRGALIFYPTWFDKIDFEVINPHKRETKAGTHPIYYEVVPPGTRGELKLLYVPWLGKMEESKINQSDAIEKLLEAIEVLIERYGFSAKRTAGWGIAEIISCTLVGNREITNENFERCRDEKKEEL